MAHIYQLSIELKGSHPLIWRRIQVTDDTLFTDLHDIIQISMGWESGHTYEFMINKTRVYDFGPDVDTGDNPYERDSMDTSLSECVNMIKTRFTYVYDFGDSWEHTIKLEKILPETEGQEFPVCIEGERACPPEDCGGIWRYQHMLHVMADTNHPEHETIKEWLGQDWDADFFDIKQVNDTLQGYAEEWEEIYKDGENWDAEEEDDDKQ